MLAVSLFVSLWRMKINELHENVLLLLEQENLLEFITDCDRPSIFHNQLDDCTLSETCVLTTTASSASRFMESNEKNPNPWLDPNDGAILLAHIGTNLS